VMGAARYQARHAPSLAVERWQFLIHAAWTPRAQQLHRLFFPQADGPCALPRIECRGSPSFLSGGADRVAVKRDNGPGVLSTQQSIFAQDYPANPCLEGVDRADSLARLKCYFYGSKTVGSFCSFSRCSGSESNGFAVVPERFGSSLV